MENNELSDKSIHQVHGLTVREEVRFLKKDVKLRIIVY